MSEITLQAKIEEFDALMSFVEQHAQKMGFKKNVLYKIKLVTEEAIVNIINYAYPNEKEDITIICQEIISPQTGLKLKIIDNGIPFDPMEKAKPDLSLKIENRPIGGLGIHMIKKMANEVSYNRNNNKNNLTIVFYL